MWTVWDVNNTSTGCEIILDCEGDDEASAENQFSELYQSSAGNS